MRIVFLDIDDGVSADDPALRPLRALGRVWFYGASDPAELHARIRRAQILIARRTRLSAAELRACPDVLAVCAFGAYSDHVDIAAARALGIPVIHTAHADMDAEGLRALVFDLVAFLDGQPRHLVSAAP